MTNEQKPERHSLALPAEAGKLFAPSAERNTGPLCDLLEQVAPRRGRALEIASGTGQHVVAFAARLPGLSWQPTEPDAARRTSIAAYVAESGLTNIAPPIALDATAPGWGAEQAGQSLIFLSNLLHLIPMRQVETLIAEAAQALAPAGRLVIYGPFMRAGELTSEGDRRFHAALVAEDPRIGYKDDRDIMELMQAAGLEIAGAVEMPANNLALVAERPPT